MREALEEKPKKNDGFVIETSAIENGIKFNFLHNPITGEWRKEKA